jgi:antitoxin component of MazEF toxin-antitoxin module
MEGKAVKARIIRIGRSQGIRIPKAILEQTGLSGEVELIVEGGALVIRAAGMSRLPPYAKLRELAKKSPPPASWFNDEENPCNQLAAKARAGWDAAFKDSVERGDGESANADVPCIPFWDDEEWDW